MLGFSWTPATALSVLCPALRPWARLPPHDQGAAPSVLESLPVLLGQGSAHPALGGEDGPGPGIPALSLPCVCKG